MNLRILLTGLAALTLAASCTSGTEGIFASIEREQKIVDSGNLSNTSTVTHMAELGGKYYAAGGRALFSRATTSDNWRSTVTINGAAPRNFMAVGKSASTLFAIANAGASASNALYSSPDGSTWTKVTLGVVPAALVPVRGDDGVTSDELVVTGDDFQTVFRITGGIVGSGVDLGTPGGNEITAAAKTGTDYYLVNESNLYHLANFASPSVVDLSALPISGHGYRGVVTLATTGDADFDGKAYLSTKTGYLVQGTLTGGLWSASVRLADAVNEGTDTVWLDQLLYQPETPSVWVSTGAGTLYEGYGYGEVSATGTFTILPPAGTDSNNYTSSELNTFASPLLFAGSDGTTFLGTVAHGLWSWDSGTGIWEQQ